MYIVNFVSPEQYPTSVYSARVFNILPKLVKEGTFHNSGPCVDLGT